MTQDELKAWLLVAGFKSDPVADNSLSYEVGKVWIHVSLSVLFPGNVNLYYFDDGKEYTTEFNSSPKYAFNFIKRRFL